MSTGPLRRLLEHRLQPIERAAPEGLLPRDRRGILVDEPAVLDLHRGSCRRRLGGSSRPRSSPRGPGDAHRLPVGRALSPRRARRRATARAASDPPTPRRGVPARLATVRDALAANPSPLLVHLAKPARLLVADRDHLAPPGGHAVLARRASSAIALCGIATRPRLVEDGEPLVPRPAGGPAHRVACRCRPGAGPSPRPSRRRRADGRAPATRPRARSLAHGGLARRRLRGAAFSLRRDGAFAAALRSRGHGSSVVARPG